MKTLCKVLLVGNLGDKPVIKENQAGEKWTRLRVATNRSFLQDGQQKEETEWHTVFAYGKLAERCVAWLDKGRGVFVEGSLRSNEWTDKDGVVQRDRHIRAQEVHFMDRAQKREGEALATAA